MKKIKIYTEVAYLLGIVFVAFGVACATKSDLGLSMIPLPAYVFHLKVVKYLSFFTFGTAEYVLQAVILIIMCLIMRKAKLSYLFSFVTAVVYGFVLDGFILLLGDQPMKGIALRILMMVIAMICGAFGVASMFRTYIAPEAYELFVKEVSEHFGIEIHKFKTGYDISSLILGIALSFIFFGLTWPKGFGISTIIMALFNGFIISRFSKLYDKYFEFEDKFPKFKKLFK